MREVWVFWLGAVSLTATGCAPPHPRHHPAAELKTIARLDCPDTQGGFTRTSAAADGSICVYADPGGTQLTLQLVSLNGADPKAALAPLEARLQAELPAKTTQPPAPADRGKVDIDLPGLHIHADGRDGGETGGDQVRIRKDLRLGGARGEPAPGDRPGDVVVDAGDDGARIRVSEPGSGVRLAYLLASESPGPNGYRMAGYIARGPADGPLAVASVLARHEGHERVDEDASALLKRNVGG